MTMWVDKSCPVIHWCASLVLEPGWLEKIEADEDFENLNGSVQICADQGQPLPLKMGLTPITPAQDVRKLNKHSLSRNRSDKKHFLVGGSAQAMIPGDGLYGFAIYGFAPGLRVAWAAVSQASA
jgi:hypothetical protein